MSFTWIKVHEAIVEYLKDKQNSQLELINILNESGVDVNTDVDENENEVNLTEIDPFSFFGQIYKNRNRREVILNNIANKLNIGLTASDTEGLPHFSDRRKDCSVLLFPFKKDRTNEIEELWTAFGKFINKSVDKNEKVKIFEELISKYEIGWFKLTTCLYYILPNEFVPLDSNTLKYLKSNNLMEKRITNSLDYFNLIDKLKKQEIKLYKIPYLAISNIIINETNYFSKRLSDYNQEDLDNYFSFLKGIITHFKINKNDKRIYLNYYDKNEKITRLIFVIGQRYCWILDKKLNYGAISKNRFGDSVEDFEITNDKLKTPVYLNYYKDYNKTIQNKTPIFEALENELKSTTKSSHRKYHKQDLEDYIFDVIFNKEFNRIEQNKMEENNSINAFNCSNFSKNQILYGPPGTGKTYNTVRLAVQILDCLKELPEYNADTINKYNQYKKEGRLSFVTFHQNFSYEDFIQGLRPDPNSEEGMKFIKSDGIFKEIANRAENNIKESFKKPEELSERDSFINALEELKDRVTTNDEDVKISESAYLYSVEEDAFRYTGKNWTLNDKGFNGFRMRYNDLIEIYDNKVNERKQIKELNNISGLAKQHATYFYNTYKILLDEMKPNSIDLNIVKKQSYILIIDEINRANISRVFGELITLIEEDKRWNGDPEKVNWQVTLPSGDPFVIPDNLYIIGTMNTADKSIALLDVALRRRFTFKAMYPLYEIDGVKYLYSDYLKKLNSLIVEKLGAGRGHDLQIGHSYFMEISNNQEFIDSMNNKVIPLLMEYLMNDLVEVIKLVNTSLKGEQYCLKTSENKKLNDTKLYDNIKELDYIYPLEIVLCNTLSISNDESEEK